MISTWSFPFCELSEITATAKRIPKWNLGHRRACRNYYDSSNSGRESQMGFAFESRRKGTGRRLPHSLRRRTEGSRPSRSGRCGRDTRMTVRETSPPTESWCRCSRSGVRSQQTRAAHRLVAPHRSFPILFSNPPVRPGYQQPSCRAMIPSSGCCIPDSTCRS